MSKHRHSNYEKRQRSYSLGKPQFVSSGVQLIALDTNVLLDMAHDLNGVRKDVGIKRDNFFDRMAEIRKLAEKGKIKFVIPSTVLQELFVSGISFSEQKFIKNYCLVLQPKNKDAMAEKVSKLTMSYVKEGIIPRGKPHPYGDAMIMAQATVAGLNILTNNYKDFEVYDDELNFYKIDKLGDYVPKKQYSDDMIPEDTSTLNENELEEFLKLKGRYRAVAIGKFNNENGYSYVNKKGFKVKPMPFTTMDFIGKLSKEEGLWRSSQFTTNFNFNEFNLVPMESGK